VGPEGRGRKERLETGFKSSKWTDLHFMLILWGGGSKLGGCKNSFQKYYFATVILNGDTLELFTLGFI
jgi:hypothetical protein